MTRLDDYAAPRQRVKEFLNTHRSSIAFFWDELDQVFFRTNEDRLAATEAGQARVAEPGKIKRLTSTVTCMESLLEAPEWFEEEAPEGNNQWATERLAPFIAHALTDREAWLSDEAAWVYCRVRALGGALRLLKSGANWSDAEKATAADLLEWAWSSRYNEGGSFGLREATAYPRSPQELGSKASSRQYPANAFLTYWGLLAAELSGHLPLEQSGAAGPRARSAARDWLRENLATQVTFHFSRSAHADPQQLAWSLCGLIRFGDGAALANTNSVEHGLLIAGLRAFFEQGSEGVWATGAPLFHYRNAGNAYAYVYETLGELLSLATSADVSLAAAEAVRDALREYGAELERAFSVAQAAGQVLAEGVIGWSSGHHPHRNTPESWATASVFRFAQAFRRLLGLWSAAEARVVLGARRSNSGLKELREIGASWDLGSGSAGAVLSTAFVQPALLASARDEEEARFPRDPDQPILGKTQARSAMLFGPPGTGKTKLIEAIAGALNWHFVEITPAHFLDQGVDFVSARADEIFREVMELDRCVILLDEIDELIQRRSDGAAPLSRFFTTTMLPRLAKLWEARRVLFFVNTNNIRRVDSAVVRSQRFDAALLILPAGYSTKAGLLADAGLTLRVAEAEITRDLKDPSQAANNGALGWFALVRYDQMGAVVAELSGLAPDGNITAEHLLQGLGPISHELARLDWDSGDENGGRKVESATKVAELPEVAAAYAYERNDSRIQLYAQLSPESALPDGGSPVEEWDGSRWIQMGSPTNPGEWAKARGGVLSPDGVLVVGDGTGDTTTL